MDELENVLIVDFASAGFFTAWIVTTLKVADLIPAFIDIGNQVPFCDLLMVDVKKDFAGRAVNGFT